MEQIEFYTELFTPIKDKILAMCQGNHENRAYKSEGIDLTKIVASQLGIPDKFCITSALLFLRFGEESRGRKATGKNQLRLVPYVIYLNHGSGGGKREGGKINRLADMASIVDADIYIHAHTHLPAVLKTSYFRTDTQNRTFKAVDKLFVNTAATLEYGGYGEVFEFKPSSKATPVIYLDGTKKEMAARL
jgi:predicted phosphodiesterase